MSSESTFSARVPDPAFPATRSTLQVRRRCFGTTLIQYLLATWGLGIVKPIYGIIGEFQFITTRVVRGTRASKPLVLPPRP